MVSPIAIHRGTISRRALALVAIAVISTSFLIYVSYSYLNRPGVEIVIENFSEIRSLKPSRIIASVIAIESPNSSKPASWVYFGELQGDRIFIGYRENQEFRRVVDSWLKWLERNPTRGFGTSLVFRIIVETQDNRTFISSTHTIPYGPEVVAGLITGRARVELFEIKPAPACQEPKTNTSSTIKNDLGDISPMQGERDPGAGGGYKYYYYSCTRTTFASVVCDYIYVYYDDWTNIPIVMVNNPSNNLISVSISLGMDVESKFGISVSIDPFGLLQIGPKFEITGYTLKGNYYFAQTRAISPSDGGYIWMGGKAVLMQIRTYECWCESPDKCCLTWPDPSNPVYAECNFNNAYQGCAELKDDRFMLLVNGIQLNGSEIVGGFTLNRRLVENVSNALANSLLRYGFKHSVTLMPNQNWVYTSVVNNYISCYMGIPNAPLPLGAFIAVLLDIPGTSWIFSVLSSISINIENYQGAQIKVFGAISNGYQNSLSVKANMMASEGTFYVRDAGCFVNMPIFYLYVSN